MFSTGKPVTKESLVRGTRSLIHRGPDSQTQWVAAHGRIGLGHSRLSIIDLTTGDQPLSNEDGRIHAVVNGELYQHDRIMKELEAKGHRFRTQSDSEILIHLYEEYGTQCLNQLRGEFAFVLWDEANGQLFAGRDRFGIKPLFYAEQDGTLYLASEAKALFAMGVTAAWDEESVFQTHASNLLNTSRTLYKNVSAVPPGHYLIASRGQRQILNYWDFDYPRAPIDEFNESEMIERFRDKLEEAVKIRLRADVPVGCYLSGGLDSCSVLGIAATYSTQPIQAFTLTFEQAEYDEGEIARAMAAHAGAHFHPIAVGPSDLAENFAGAVWHCETFFHNPHGIAKYLLSRFVHNSDYKVVLTGEGSDEIFGGYVHFRRDLLMYQRPGETPESIQEQLDELKRTNLVSHGMLITDAKAPDLASVRRALGYVPSFFEVQAVTAQKMLGLLKPEFLRKFEGRDPFRAFLNTVDNRQLQGRDPVNQSLYLWSKTSLPNYILTVLGDRMEMAHSIEGRVPFLDHELVELVAQLPVHLKIRGLTEKYILREAARPFLTDTVYRRQKHPFLAPPAAGKQDGPLFELIQETLRGPMLAAVGFYDQKKVIEWLDDLPSMSPQVRATLDPLLMSLTSACFLQQQFGL